MLNALQSTVWIIHDDPRSIFHDFFLILNSDLKSKLQNAASVYHFDAKGGLHLTLHNVTLLYVIVYKDKQDFPRLSSNMVTLSYVNGFPTSRSFKIMLDTPWYTLKAIIFTRTLFFQGFIFSIQNDRFGKTVVRCQHGWAGVACQQYVPPPGALSASLGIWCPSNLSKLYANTEYCIQSHHI